MRWLLAQRRRGHRGEGREERTCKFISPQRRVLEWGFGGVLGC